MSEPRKVWCPMIQQMVHVKATIEWGSLPTLTVLTCQKQNTCKHFKRGECKVGMVLEGRW